MDGAGVVQWLAIGLSLAAVVVILRYARQPRCELCARRHARRDMAPAVPEAGLVGLEVPDSAERAAISWKADQL